MAKKPSKKSADTASQAEPGNLADVGMGLVASDIILRSAGRLTRQSLEKAVARRRLDPVKAKELVENRGFLRTVATFGVTRIATRSVPGALLVGGGLLAKALFDRGSAKRKSRRAAKQSIGTKSAD